MWTRTFDVTRDGRALTAYRLGRGRSGGGFELGGIAYGVRSHLAPGTFEMVAGDGMVVASAEHVGRQEWTVRASGRELRFRREAAASGRYALLGPDGAAAGRVTVSGARTVVEADLPGVEPEVQVFVIAALLLRRRRRRHAVAHAAPHGI